MLLCRAARRGLAPLPDDVAIPIKLTDGLVLEYSRHARDHAGLAAGHIGELDHDVPTRAADQRRVEHAAREAAMIPAMHLVAFHVDEVRLVIAAAEQDKDVVRLTGIVARHTRGIDAGSGMDDRRPPNCDEKDAQRQVPSMYGLTLPRPSGQPTR